MPLILVPWPWPGTSKFSISFYWILETMSFVMNILFSGLLSISTEILKVLWGVEFHFDFYTELYLKRNEGLRPWDYICFGFSGKLFQIKKLQQANQCCKNKCFQDFSFMILCFRNTHGILESPACTVTTIGENLRGCLSKTAGSPEAKFSGKWRVTYSVWFLFFSWSWKAAIWNDKIWVISTPRRVLLVTSWSATDKTYL